MGPIKLTPDVERFLDRLWTEAKQKAFDKPGTFGKYGVIIEVADSVFVEALPQCHPVVRMPKANQTA